MVIHREAQQQRLQQELFSAGDDISSITSRGAQRAVTGLNAMAARRGYNWRRRRPASYPLSVQQEDAHILAMLGVAHQASASTVGATLLLQRIVAGGSSLSQSDDVRLSGLIAQLETRVSVIKSTCSDHEVAIITQEQERIKSRKYPPNPLSSSKACNTHYPTLHSRQWEIISH